MRKALIAVHGYFGDHLFANSIAEHLIKEDQYDTVDYVIGFPQVLPFFERNPFIDKVFLNGVGPSPAIPNTGIIYDKVFQLGTFSKKIPPAMEMQLFCGVRNPSSKFYVYTNPELDKLVETEYTDNKDSVVAVMNGWRERTFAFTREEYAVGNTGKRRRNTDYIVNQIESRQVTMHVGTSPNVNQFSVEHDEASLDLTASLLKYADVFIGGEGGLANLAYAVGTSTILTSDFIHYLYGPNGKMFQLQEPNLGPYYYEHDTGYHINLDPYLTDEEVANNILTILNEKL
jgi:hypothetical protein